MMMMMMNRQRDRMEITDETGKGMRIKSG